MDHVLQIIGLVTVCYGVWRLVVFALDSYTDRLELRAVMEGRTTPPWEPETVRIVRVWDDDYSPYDQDRDIS